MNLLYAFVFIVSIFVWKMKNLKKIVQGAIFHGWVLFRYVPLEDMELKHMHHSQVAHTRLEALRPAPESSRGFTLE